MLWLLGDSRSLKCGPCSSTMLRVQLMFWASCSQPRMSQISTSAHDMSTGCPANRLVTQQVTRLLLPASSIQTISRMFAGCSRGMIHIVNAP